MNIIPGQGILLKLPYADGGMADKQRTFIVIGSSGNTIEMLNVSTIKGKIHKLSFPSNELLKSYNPPFCRPSFVKLDAIYKIDYFDELEYCLLSKGKSLDNDELNRITERFNTYKNSNKILTKYLNIEEVMKYNIEYFTQQLSAVGKDDKK